MRGRKGRRGKPFGVSSNRVAASASTPETAADAAVVAAAARRAIGENKEGEISSSTSGMKKCAKRGVGGTRLALGKGSSFFDS